MKALFTGDRDVIGNEEIRKFLYLGGGYKEFDHISQNNSNSNSNSSSNNKSENFNKSYNTVSTTNIYNSKNPLIKLTENAMLTLNVNNNKELSSNLKTLRPSTSTSSSLHIFHREQTPHKFTNSLRKSEPLYYFENLNTVEKNNSNSSSMQLRRTSSSHGRLISINTLNEAIINKKKPRLINSSIKSTLQSDTLLSSVNIIDEENYPISTSMKLTDKEVII